MMKKASLLIVGGIGVGLIAALLAISPKTDQVPLRSEARGDNADLLQVRAQEHIGSQSHSLSANNEIQLNRTDSIDDDVASLQAEIDHLAQSIERDDVLNRLNSDLTGSEERKLLMERVHRLADLRTQLIWRKIEVLDQEIKEAKR